QNRRPLFATAPLITNISTTASRGRSDYKGLQASVRQRATHGLEYLASYTLGKANTNQLGYYGSGGFTAAEGTYWMNAYDPEANYGPAFFDVRHNFVFSASYELPYGRDRAGEVRFELFNLLDRANFRAPARDINSPNTFGQITQTLSSATVSTARTGELVLKFFF